MNKEELREIPKKNYLILGVLIIVTLFLLYYFYLWVDAYNETKLNRPILDKYMEVINYNELDNYLVENPDTIIYVSVLEDKSIREFEKKVKGLYKKHEIDRDILYMDITNFVNDNSVKNEMINKYSVGSTDMTKVPNVMVFENGHIREIYIIHDDNYNIANFKAFLTNISFSNEEDING